jgi:prevent-host-death family protein
MINMAPERTIAVSRFKAECLGLLDEVAASGQPIIVTKRGKPVARVVPLEPAPSLLGSVTQLVSDEELIAPLGVGWDVERGWDFDDE